MERIYKQTPTLILLTLLGACTLADIAGGGNGTGKPKKDKSEAQVEVKPPCVPSYIRFDSRLFELIAHDQSHCIQGQSCQFRPYNTGRVVIKFSIGGMQQLSNREIEEIEDSFEFKVTIKAEGATYMDHDESRAINPGFFFQFESNDDMRKFKELCGLE